VTIGELRLGVLMAEDVETRHRRLTTLELALLLDPPPIDDRVADVWAGLVAGLRAQGRRMPLNDSWIAATAMAHHLPVVTQDDDFDDVPELAIIKL
jgi:predicted nucleic acid-binding protein